MTPFELFIVQYGNYPLKIMSSKKKAKTKQNKAKKKKKTDIEEESYSSFDNYYFWNKLVSAKKGI